MNKEELKKLVDHYMSLKYPIKISEMEEGGYFVEVVDLPGCMCDTKTIKEIPAKIEKSKRAWLEGVLEREGQVPLPKKEEVYSGRFVIRIPKTLHKILAERAEQEGTSLNSYALMLLSFNSEKRKTTLWEETMSWVSTQGSGIVPSKETNQNSKYETERSAKAA
jgi:antitoxin HicB